MELLPATSAEPSPWLCPIKHPPPTGKKIQLLTYTGVECLGKWEREAGFIAWAPLNKIPPEIKGKIGKFPSHT